MKKLLNIGDVITVYGHPCRITKVWPLGTVDVLRVDGSLAYRVTGLYGQTVKR